MIYKLACFDKVRAIQGSVPIRFQMKCRSKLNFERWSIISYLYVRSIFWESPIILINTNTVYTTSHITRKSNAKSRLLILNIEYFIFANSEKVLGFISGKKTSSVHCTAHGIFVWYIEMLIPSTSLLADA